MLSILRHTSRSRLSALRSICPLFQSSKRFLHLHEYQSMDIMHDYGVKTPLYFTASTPSEAEAAAQQLSSISKTHPLDFVVKAQVLAGGRGLGYFKENNYHGGVQICTTPAEVGKVAAQMLNKTLITKQTGAEGKPCHKVLVTERFYIRKERYFAMILDRESSGLIVLGSSVGGTNIEDIAEKFPESIFKMSLDLNKPPTHDQLITIAKKLGFTETQQIDEAVASILGIYHMFVEKDCLMVEVNPFASTSTDRVLVCDAKVNFDDNAAYRQQNIFKNADESQMDPREVEAARANLSYVGLDGNIGCMVNGAGLAMSTMDIIQLHGGKPANFLDVGGGAQDQEVVQALSILQNDSNVHSIFVNIFGGIMRCDIIAQGLINASKKIGLTKPIVLRLEGTNKAEAQKLLANTDMETQFIFEDNFSEAAKKCSQIAKIVEEAQKASLSVSFR